MAEFVYRYLYYLNEYSLKDISQKTYKKRSKEELRRIQLVYQLPDVALNPRQTVGETRRPFGSVDVEHPGCLPDGSDRCPHAAAERSPDEPSPDRARRE